MSRLAWGPRNRANSPARRVAFSAFLGAFLVGAFAIASAAGAPAAPLLASANAAIPAATKGPRIPGTADVQPAILPAVERGDALTIGTSARQPRAQAALASRRSQALGTQIFVGPPPEPLDAGSSPARPPAPAPLGADAVGRAALERISYPWETQLPGWTIEFVSPRGELRGLTIDDERRIEISVQTDNIEAVARVLAHELGHAVDIAHNNTVRRRQWETARGIGDTFAWWPTPGQADFSTGAGDFAECFAGWQLGSVSRSAFGACSSADLELMAQLAQP